MASDLPHVEYNKKKAGYTKQDYDESVIANEEIYQRYLASQKEKEGVEIDLTKLLNSTEPILNEA